MNEFVDAMVAEFVLVVLPTFTNGSDYSKHWCENEAQVARQGHGANGVCMLQGI